MKPIKIEFNRTSLIAHLAEVSTIEAKTVKAVMALLEATMLASLNKKGPGRLYFAQTAEGQCRQRPQP